MFKNNKFYRNKADQSLAHWGCWGEGVRETALVEVSFLFCLRRCVTIFTCLIIIYIINMCVYLLSHFSCVRLFVTLWTCNLSGSSVHGILQARRVLEWVACCPPGDLPDSGMKPAFLMSPALASRFFTTSSIWEDHIINIKYNNLKNRLYKYKLYMYVYTFIHTHTRLITFQILNLWIYLLAKIKPQGYTQDTLLITHRYAHMQSSKTFESPDVHVPSWTRKCRFLISDLSLEKSGLFTIYLVSPFYNFVLFFFFW